MFASESEWEFGDDGIGSAAQSSIDLDPTGEDDHLAHRQNVFTGDTDDGYIVDDCRAGTPEAQSASGNDLSVEEATMKIADFLIAKVMEGQWWATDVCVLCHWMSIAGIKGAVAELGLKPGHQSGKYRPHFRKVLGLGKTTPDSSRCLCQDLDRPMLLVFPCQCRSIIRTRRYTTNLLNILNY